MKRKAIMRSVSAAVALSMALGCAAGVFAEGQVKYGSIDSVIDMINAFEEKHCKGLIEDDPYTTSFKNYGRFALRK